MNNITLNWSAEDRARVDKLIGLLEGLNVAAEAKGLIETVTVEEDLYIPETTAEQPQEAPEPVEQEQTTPQEPETAQDEPQEAVNEATAPSPTREDIRKKVIDLCGAGKKAEAQAIIKSRADSVSNLKDETLVEVWDELTALEG